MVAFAVGLAEEQEAEKQRIRRATRTSVSNHSLSSVRYKILAVMQPSLFSFVKFY